MCGICGILGPPAPGRVEGMVRAMRHRGPDDSGMFAGDGAALGMARLAILDVTPSGHQPMATPDGHRRPILLGEFGAYEKAPFESRVLYTAAVARAAEARSWAWAYWQFDSDFIVYDIDKDRWVDPLLRALIPR